MNRVIGHESNPHHILVDKNSPRKMPQKQTNSETALVTDVVTITNHEIIMGFGLEIQDGDDEGTERLFHKRPSAVHIGRVFGWVTRR